MKNLLKKELTNTLDHINTIERIISKFRSSYKTCDEHVSRSSDPFGYIKFNGVTNLRISIAENNFVLKLYGFEFAKANGAKISKQSGMDAGTIELKCASIGDDELSWVVNNLAQYGNIFPL